MRWIFYLCAAATLASCNEGSSDAGQSEDDRAVVEQVREANEAAPPLVEVVPEPLLYTDIEANDLYGLTCSYAPGVSLGARVIAREADAYMKIEDELIRFAADPGSRELPANTRSFYNGREYSLRLEIEEPNNTDDVESRFHQGTVWLRDRWDRVVYQGSGPVDCGD